jgi:hypothetical protein
VRPANDSVALLDAALVEPGSFWNVPRISTRRFINCCSVVCSPPVSRRPLLAAAVAPTGELGSVPDVPVGVPGGGVDGCVPVALGGVGGGGGVGGVAGGGVVIAGVGVAVGLDGSVATDPAGAPMVGFARTKLGVVAVVVPAGPVTAFP